ncbi:MAG: hypothetical protein COS99_03160 [Candidatus Omnitrophica bacterium CG07_land_8_20_14_0_80_42_15]|uniref:Uncharacterized protein n=1 Tax=Candidatus Aquitaenariimonas noxiae TaxID=1974741 RepID=A0A2J0KZN7_9BACT|nr:MAG: hypothetical protein COS99_03160 [Candidatus Omnitrophica bacterium CG07_land_8_20_14_0_80_42_15]
MKLTKKITLKRISVSATFKIVFWLYMIIALIIGLAATVFNIGIMPSSWVKQIPYLGTIGVMGVGVIAAFAFAVINGLGAGIVAALLALIYNLFALMFGGFRFTIEE